MKKRFAKFISLALVLIMVLSAVPVSAAAPARGDGGIGSWIGDWIGWWFRPISGGFYRPDYPAQTLEASTLGGTCLTVDAPEGALPAGAKVEAVSIEDIGAVQDAFDEASPERGHVAFALDINFEDRDDNAIEPKAPVTVILTNDMLEGMEDVRLVHFKGGADDIATAEMEFVEGFYLSGSTITFDAEDFSVYAVIGDGHSSEYARLNVRFFHRDDDTEPAYQVYVTQRDIDILGTIIEDPELPEVGAGEMFCGWYVGTGYTTNDADGTHSIDDIRDKVKTRLQSPVTEGDTFDVYAMVFNYFNIAYVDENGATTLDYQTIFSKESSINYTIYHLYTPEEQGYRFTGWQKDDGDDTVYQNNSEVTISNTLTTLRAQVQQGYWLTFEENPGGNFKGATYNAPIFCPYGNIPSNARPTPNPELAGYDFGGWYTTYANGTWSNQFSFTGTISQDTTVYAKWTLKSSVPYTLIVWKQSVDDDKNTAEANKTYDYAFSTTLNAAPNTAISSLNLNYYMTLHAKESGGNEYYINANTNGSGTWYNFNGFEFGHGPVSSDSSVTTVLPNGTTVINIYWNRVLVTYNFYTQGGYTQTTTWSSGSTYVVGPDGSYALLSRYSVSGGYAYYYPISSMSYMDNTDTDNQSYDNTHYFFTYNNTNIWVWWNGSNWQYKDADNNYSGTFTSSIFSNYGLNYWIGSASGSDLSSLGSSTGLTFYSYSSSSSFSRRDTFTGLYGQKLSKYGYVWPYDYRWFMNSVDSGSFVSIADTFMRWNASTGWTSNFYGGNQSTGAYIYHYLMKVDGTYGSTPDFTVQCGTTDGMLFRSFTGVYSSEYRVKLPSGTTTYYITTDYTTTNAGTSDESITVNSWGSAITATDYHDGAYWTEWIPDGTVLKFGSFAMDDTSHIQPQGGAIDFRYARNKYRIHYMVGKYADGNGNAVDGPMAGQLKQSPTIYYEASIDSYKVGGANYYDPIAAGDFTDESFIFAGWYVDPGCTTAYDFTGKTMPLNGVTVYAKFIKRQYRVFLEPNLPTDPNFQVKWAESSQAMNFRVDYLGQISDGQPIEASDANGNYVLVGWYIDEACTEPYNFATRLNDEIAVDYPKTEPTESNGTNGDINRPWITKKVVIYAKWRKVLPGANGITVLYDAIEQAGVTGHTGTFAEIDGTPTNWEDPLRYMDKATAYARTASTPDIPKDWQFLGWQLLDKNGDPVEGKFYYPGQPFEVDAQYAVESTLRLSPVYGEKGTKSGSIDTKAGETWVEYTASTIDTSKTYLIGFEVGSTVYLMVNKKTSESGNSQYYTSSSSIYYGYTAPASFSGGKIVGVSGNATDLLYCSWKFSSSTGGTISSASETGRYLYAYTSTSSSYCDLYPSTSAPSYNWVWNSSNHTLALNGSKYAQYYSLNSGKNMRTATSAGTNGVVRLYVQDSSGSGSSETVDFKKVTTPVVGVPYVIVSDVLDAYALSKDRHPNTDLTQNKCWLLSVAVTKTGDIIAVPEDEVSNVTWVAGGNASAGYTWRNVANNNYLGLTSAGYLIDSTTSVAWLYDSNRYFNNQIESDGYYYLSLDTDDTTYYDYTVAKASGADAISIYARAYNLTITYVMADGTTAPAAHNSQVAQGESYSVTVPSINGYTPSQTTVSGTMGTSDVEVTVTYTKNAAATYTVTFQDWDGTVLKTQTVTEGQAATAPADPSRAGYTFTGWDVDFSNVTSNLTVTAQYEQNSSQGEGHWEWKPVTTIIPDEDYLIGFVASGVTYLAVNYNDTATNHYYNSYTASGSSTAHWLGYTAIATIENDLVVGCTGNVTNLDYCVWNFSSATGGTITSGYESGRYLQTATSVTTYQDLYPGTTSSNAANWVWNSTDKTLTRTVSGTTVYAEHASAGGTGHYMGVFTSRTASEYVQLYHKEWVEEQVTVMHTVTFVDGYNGSIIAAHTVEDGAAMPATPATPDHSADNYYFVRWNPDPANYTTVTEDLTFTAYYEFQQTGYYLVTFKDWNGRVLSTQTVAEGDPASAPADPSRPGYNFTGWDKDFSSITSNLVVYATYSKTVSMAYTVTLQATYGPRVTQEKTHITWHSNNGSGEYKNSKDVIMNEDIPVEYPEGTAPSGAKVSWTEGGDLVWEDHVFLGWARITIGNKDDGIYPEFDPENTAYVEERTYGESDLFLKYVSPTGSETQGKFLAKNPSTGNWVEVENVAADELMPYHGMYAVWGTVFYVYHSGTGVVEKRVITKDDGAYNLTQNIDNAYLYGGYYKAYAGVSTGYDSKALDWDDILVVRSADGSIDTSASKWYQTDNDDGVGAVKYDGSNATWVYDQAYKTTDENAETGLAITPVAGTTYYIKEVPAAKYLRPYLHYTYYLESGSISTAWLISDVDDLNYQQTGFRIVSADKEAENVVASLTVSTSNGSNTIKLTPKRVFGAKGYLSYLTVINHGSNGEPVVNLLGDNSAVMQYWVTPDGLFVSGTVSREYTGLGNVSDIGFTPTEGSSTIEVFRGNN